MKLTGENRSTRGKACPSATLSATNPTWTDQGSKPGLRGERPATNPLIHGTALCGGNFMHHQAKYSNILRYSLRGWTSKRV
jgi:hypothetical protein